MILPTLDTRYKDDLDFFLIEDVTLFSYDLDYSWMDLVLRNRYWLKWPDLIDFRYMSDMLLDLVILRLTLIEWECVIILIELKYEDLIICIKTCSISAIEIRIYQWFRGWICRWLWGYELIIYIARIILFMTVGYYSSWISWFTWETWLTIFGIYLITIMSMLPLIAGKKYYYTVTTPICYTCYMPCYTGILFTKIIYLVIPVSWLHMLMLLPTELSQWSK